MNQSIPLNIEPTSAIRHRIKGVRYADSAVISVEILMHRFVELEEWAMKTASNAFWRLYWPASRGGYLTFQGHEQELEPNQLYLVSPHTTFDSRCSKRFGKWYVHFLAKGLQGVYRPGIVKLRPTTRIKELLARTCPLSAHAHKIKQKGYALETLELVLLALQLARPQLSMVMSTDRRLQIGETFLREHLTEKIRLEDLSRAMGVSNRLVSNIFNSGFGFPPMRYLIELRLNHAMNLLRHTEFSIDQIAEQCGFPNRYYFTRMLSKYHKTTPAAFRKQIANPNTRPSQAQQMPRKNSR